LIKVIAEKKPVGGKEPESLRRKAARPVSTLTKNKFDTINSVYRQRMVGKKSAIAQGNARNGKDPGLLSGKQQLLGNAQFSSCTRGASPPRASGGGG